MPLFSWTSDRELMEQYNAEIYGLYFHMVEVYKLQFKTGTHDDIYHEDVNFDIADTPSYEAPGYINVSDNGLATLTKAGQQIDRQLALYFSRKSVETILVAAGLDRYDDVPNDGDVVKIQDVLWEVITVDPEGYHMNDRRYPFDMQILIKPWDRDAVPRPRRRRR